MASRFGTSTTGAGGTAVGAAPTGYSPAYGGIPQVPSLLDIYGQSIGANQRFLPALTQLGTQISGGTEQELLNNLRMALPGYDASVGKSMGNIGALQRGEIPSDVSNLLKQQAAERGIATGLYNSPNANAALLSALGQTSLGLQGEGEKQMSALVNRTPQAQPFDVSRLLMNPTDLYEQQLLANMYRAAPVPKSAAEQLISDQMGGYQTGRGNVPSYGPTGGGGGSPIPMRTDWASDRPNPPTIGGTGPFERTPAPFTGTYQNLQAGGGEVPGMEWDPQMGAMFNRFTGQYNFDESDPNAWLTWGGANGGGEDFSGAADEFYSD